MRTLSSFHPTNIMSTATTSPTSDTTVATVPSAKAKAEETGVARSPWHSPVPYLFGGLAAMLGLIAFALLILACSYWKLSNNGEIENEGGGEEDREGEVEMKGGGEKLKMAPVLEEKLLVIMAGNDKPTFIATPRFSKADRLSQLQLIGNEKLDGGNSADLGGGNQTRLYVNNSEGIKVDIGCESDHTQRTSSSSSSSSSSDNSTLRLQEQGSDLEGQTSEPAGRN